MNQTSALFEVDLVKEIRDADESAQRCRLPLPSCCTALNSLNSSNSFSRRSAA
jgi:hypothetical protein